MSALKPRTLISLWLPVGLWCLFIFSLSSIPNLRFFKESTLDFVFRKAGHMGEYAVLARLLARAFTGSTFWSWKKIFVCSLGLAILFCMTDELHQHFVPGRHGSPRDVVIDSTGAWLGLGLVP